MGEAALAWIVPTLLSVATTGVTSYRQRSGAERSQRHAEQRSWARWQEASKPDPEAMRAAESQYRGQLGQARAGSYRSLASQLAARGFGSGSGLGTQAAADIEGSYLRGLGQMGTELTKYQGTPLFGPPSSIYPQPTTGATSMAVGSAQSAMNQALGYYAMNKMLNQPGSNINYYDYGPSKWHQETYGGGW